MVLRFFTFVRNDRGLNGYKIIIVGTAHTLQCGVDNYSKNQINKFKSFIEEKCKTYNIKLIAEEMSCDGLIYHEVTSTIAYKIALKLPDTKHAYVELSEQEKRNLKIDNDSLSTFSMFRLDNKGDANNKIKDLYKKISDPVREICWFAKILDINKWPALLICGDDHVLNLCSLIKSIDEKILLSAFYLSDYFHEDAPSSITDQ